MADNPGQPQAQPPSPTPSLMPMAASLPVGGQEIRKPDLQMLLQDLATAQRTLFEERRHAERRVAEERERSRWEQERLRSELGEKLRDVERQNEVLVRTLGRFQAENEHLRVEIAVAQAERTNGYPVPHEPQQRKDVPTVVATPSGPIPVPTSPKLPVVPPQDPVLGARPLRLTEPPGMPPGGP